jgi:putative transposase
MLLSIKTKLKLSKNQSIVMCKHAGIARFTYNWGLATWQELYQDGLKPDKYLLKKIFNNHVKPEFTWIKETGICQKITQYAFDNLGDAFSRFFSGKGGYPNFKKKGHHDSFTIDAGGKPIPVGGKSIKLPTMSTGVVFPNPKHYKTNLENLRRLSRKFARKVKGYNNRHKAKIQLAKHHARIANLRKDTLHQITTFLLCKNHAKIVVEHLNISAMLANHKLAKVIADCGFHELKRQLEYKAKKFGCEVIIADRWFPSSKTCSNCGHIQDLPLKERTYNCTSCGHSMDRDLNAAINLSRLAFIVKAYARDNRSHAPVEVRSKCLDLSSFYIAVRQLNNSDIHLQHK